MIAQIDFRLPPDPPQTTAVLKKSHATSSKVYVGCAKWGRKEWVGKIYPLSTKEKDFLRYYVRQFNCIELNATHYKIYGPEAIHKWADVAQGKDFMFCPKFPQAISHYGQLDHAHDLTSAFLEGIVAFGQHLGPCFLQFSERFSPKRWPELLAYLESLPRDLQLFLELRHPDWFDHPEIRTHLFDTLQKLQIGAVITDTSGRRDVAHMQLPTPDAFIRFVGNNLHPTDYSRIDEWVDRLKKWLDAGLRNLYFFMHQHDEKDSPELCTYLIRELNRKCGLSLAEPKFMEPGLQGSLFS